MFEVKIEDDIDSEQRNKIIITDNEGTRTYSDYGEPEDNSFYRDYKWIKPELQNAYDQGFRDGVKWAIKWF